MAAFAGPKIATSGAEAAQLTVARATSCPSRCARRRRLRLRDASRALQLTRPPQGRFLATKSSIGQDRGRGLEQIPIYKWTLTPQVPPELYRVKVDTALGAILAGAALPTGLKPLHLIPKIVYSQQTKIGGMVYMRIEEGGVERGGREAGKGGTPITRDLDEGA